MGQRLSFTNQVIHSISKGRYEGCGKGQECSGKNLSGILKMEKYPPPHPQPKLPSSGINNNYDLILIFYYYYYKKKRKIKTAPYLVTGTR